MELPTLDKFPPRVLRQIDIQTAFTVSRLIVAAERLQVFRLLDGRRRNAAAIGRALRLHEFYRDTFLNALVSLGLLHRAGDTYWNTAFAQRYFVRARSIYWTRQYSRECVQAFKTLASLEEMLVTGPGHKSNSVRKKASYVEEMARDTQLAEDFTQMLFHFHRDDAAALAKLLDLSGRHALLDVGGGSGVMSIALAKKNPRLRAAILDIAAVCKIAAGNIRRAGLSGRIGTLVGNFRKSLPLGYDVIMFCDIGALSKQHLRNAFRSLPPGGLVVAVDRFLSDDGTRPLDRLVAYFVGSSFGIATRSEMVERFEACGFQRVRARPVRTDVWLITGMKPRKTANS